MNFGRNVRKTQQWIDEVVTAELQGTVKPIPADISPAISEIIEISDAGPAQSDLNPSQSISTAQSDLNPSQSISNVTATKKLNSFVHNYAKKEGDAFICKVQINSRECNFKVLSKQGIYFVM